MNFVRSVTISLILLLALASCNQNMERVSSGETLENSPMPVPTRQTPRTPPPFAMPGMPGKQANGQPEIPPIAKAFFMHTWVEALYSLPKNKHPKPGWVSPLKDPENGRVWCTDCHFDPTID